MAGRIVGIITVLTLTGVIATAAVLLFLALDSEEETSLQTARVLAESNARWLLASDLESVDTATLEPLLEQHPATEAKLDAIWVFNVHARINASSADARTVDRDEITPARSVMEQDIGTIVESLGRGVYAGTAALRDEDGNVFGAVRVEFTSNNIGTHFDMFREEYLIGAVALLVALVFGSWFLAHRLARPIGLMVRAARAVEDGKQPEPAVAASLRNTSMTRDEYGELAGVFLDMAREVSTREIQLNALVEERTAELSQKNQALESTQLDIRNDLDMAHSVQAALVPTDLPDDPRAGVAAFMTPALDVGGDFYDAFITDDGRLAFAIADVSGKGVASALMMAVGRSLLRGAANEHPDPSDAIASTNDQLCGMNPKELFITVFFGMIDLQLGTLTYVNAGHDPPYIMRPDEEPEMLPHTGGLAIGVLPDISYAESTIPLEAGTSLFLYTDGVTEAEDANGNQFGRERLEVRLADVNGTGPKDLMDIVLKDVGEFCGDAKQFDDLTCMALQFVESSQSDSYIPGRGSRNLASGWRRMVVQPQLETSLPRVQAFVERFAESQGIDTAPVYQINLALDELLTNTIEHGFAGREQEAQISVAIRNEGDFVVVRYEDNGPEFNTLEAPEQDTELPLEERPIGGLGIQLIAAMFAEVGYERENDLNVTTLKQVRQMPDD